MLTNKTIIQSIGKAALKTFLQAFIGVLVLLAVPTLGNWVTSVQSGGEVSVDLEWWTKVFIAAVGAGIAALISFIWNSLNKTTETPVVVDPPAVVE